MTTQDAQPQWTLIGHGLKCSCGGALSEGPGKTIHPYLASAFRASHNHDGCEITETRQAAPGV